MESQDGATVTEATIGILVTKEAEAKQLLLEKAREVGFTLSGLRQMFAILNLNLHTMQLKELRDLWPYVNEINARKFG